jgi:hypothetical protein
VFSGRFIGSFCESPDQFLEDEAHLLIGNLVGMKVDRGKFLDDHEEKVLAVQIGDLLSEPEPLKNIPGVFGKIPQIGLKVLPDVRGIVEELGEGETGDGIKFLAGNFQEKGREIGDPGIFPGLIFLENLILCGFENAVQTTKDREGENDLPVVGPFVVPPEKIGNGPKKGRFFRKI